MDLRIIERAYGQYVPPGKPYLGLLDRIHRHLLPRTYAEVGVSNGSSLTLVLPGTISIGIDPAPNLRLPVRRSTRIFRQTSDDFFAQHDLQRLFGGLPLDLAFIDGMHHFEYAFRDFINLEQASSSTSTVLIHDCLPIDEVTAERERSTDVWSGDIWRLILLLREWRPDLDVEVIDSAPTGLGMVRRLDATSTVLSEHYDEIVEQYLAMPYDAGPDGTAAARINPIPGDWASVRARLPEHPFRQQRSELVTAWQAYCTSRAVGRRIVQKANARLTFRKPHATSPGTIQRFPS